MTSPAPGKTRVIVKADCEATVREEWTLDLDVEQLALVQEDPSEALDLLGGDTFVNVENVSTDNEREREIRSVEILEPTPLEPTSTSPTAAEVLLLGLDSINLAGLDVPDEALDAWRTRIERERQRIAAEA